MGEVRINIYWVPHVILSLILILSLFPIVRSVDENAYSKTGDPAIFPLVTQFIYARLSNLTKALIRDIQSQLGFCIKNVCVNPESLWSVALLCLFFFFLFGFSAWTPCFTVMLIGMEHLILKEIWIFWQIVSRKQKVWAFCIGVAVML